MTFAARAVLAVLLSAAALTACVAPANPRLRTPPLPLALQSDPSEYVVVTVPNVARPLATRPGSTPRGYDAASRYGVTASASSHAST